MSNRQRTWPALSRALVHRSTSVGMINIPRASLSKGNLTVSGEGALTITQQGFLSSNFLRDGQYYSHFNATLPPCTYPFARRVTAPSTVPVTNRAPSAASAVRLTGNSSTAPSMIINE